MLHRKELLLDESHEQFEEFSRLTSDLEQRGLLRNPRGIGSRETWNARLATAGVRVEGHALIDATDGGTRPRRISDDEASAIARHKTAISRFGLSAPLQALARHGFLDGGKTVFDYGCGRGGDLDLLEQNGVTAFGWDPHYRPDGQKRAADLVNLGFVINVIEDPAERRSVLAEAFTYAERLLVVSAMLSGPRSNAGVEYSDGVVTRRGTFQKYFTQLELRGFIESTLGAEAIPVAPGIFFVFATAQDRQDFEEARATRRATISAFAQSIAGFGRRTVDQQLYDRYPILLDRLWELWLSLGREPRSEEVPFLPEVLDLFGELRSALRFLRRLHGSEPIEVAGRARIADLQIYLALEKFEGRRRLADYSERLRRDLKAFYGTFKKAREAAEAELYRIADRKYIVDACREAANGGLGALDVDHSLTVHTSYVEQLPAVLRIYIGCATHLYGDVTSADLVKIHGQSDKLTLSSFDDFEGKALPRMTTRVKLDYRRQDFDVFEYGAEYEPPYLFLKSRFIGPDFPHYDEQAAFDEQLERLNIVDLSGYGPKPSEFDTSLHRYRLSVEEFEFVCRSDVPDLDEPCGRNLTFRDLVECGQTQRELGKPNVPRSPETYNALARLALEVLDPVMDYFGGIQLTYGFCSSGLAKHVPGGIDPRKDQHAGHELNTRGNPVCSRLGAAVDFIVPDESMLEVAAWIAMHTSYDRLYFYGDDRPIHVSIGPQSQREFVEVRTLATGRRMPRVVRDVEAYLGQELVMRVENAE
ncbi:DNA phosphorothioation-associated putative methyltransferase [Arhodomonas sp. AD133]|uniref:DNA phosphorothioation-associated putative methyltransferase n=1 Tax=Arhodomonas sp. AD133 TaxID=3415009 RepID=UPI003EB8210F